MTMFNNIALWIFLRFAENLIAGLKVEYFISYFMSQYMSIIPTLFLIIADLQVFYIQLFLPTILIHKCNYYHLFIYVTVRNYR